MQSLTKFAAEFEQGKAVQRTRDTMRELYCGRLIYSKTRWEHCGDRRKVDTPAAEWITVKVPTLRMTPSLSRDGASGKPGAAQMPHPWEGVRAATGLVTLHLRKRQRGQLPPLRRNPYTVSRGLFLLAPAQKAHSEHAQSEKTQRTGFGSGLQPNRVIAAKADDVTATIPR